MTGEFTEGVPHALISYKTHQYWLESSEHIFFFATETPLRLIFKACCAACVPAWREREVVANTPPLRDGDLPSHTAHYKIFSPGPHGLDLPIGSL